jgi:hypothetical protein
MKESPNWLSQILSKRLKKTSNGLYSGPVERGIKKKRED